MRWREESNFQNALGYIDNLAMMSHITFEEWDFLQESVYLREPVLLEAFETAQQELAKGVRDATAVMGNPSGLVYLILICVRFVSLPMVITFSCAARVAGDVFDTICRLLQKQVDIVCDGCCGPLCVYLCCDAVWCACVRRGVYQIMCAPVYGVTSRYATEARDFINTLSERGLHLPTSMYALSLLVVV